MIRVLTFTNNRMFWSRLLLALLCIYVIFSPPPVLFATWFSDLLGLIGLLLVVFAAFGRIWCLVFVAGRKNDVIVSEGPYSMTRNPLYICTFLGIVGFGLVVENPWLSLVLAVLFIVYYPCVVRREEACLASKFGSAFDEYCMRTPRWIPNFRLYHEPQMITISPAKVWKGILDSLWFMSAFFFWELLEVVREFRVS